MKHKYIIFDNEIAVCFPESLVHSDVATMQHTDGFGNWERKVPTSAGFFYVSNEISFETEDGDHWPEGRVVNKVTIYGMSESLRLKSLDGDDKIIEKSLGL